jgi:class 3 adenylate cyclase
MVKPRQSRQSSRVGRPPPSEVELLSQQVQAITRFPDQNPNPVMRVRDDGHLLYANPASAPLRRALGAEAGDVIGDEMLARLHQAAERGQAIELVDDHQTYSVLAVTVPDFGFTNLYGTDVTAKKAIDKFPDQNPNPVLRIDRAGRLIYANLASAPIVEAQHLQLGAAVPRNLLDEVQRSLAQGERTPLEIVCGERIFELLPVDVPEFEFVNLYGTDVTAARQIAEALRENERLLLNILPPPIANRLRHGERVIADRFDDVTLLIADIVGFTSMSSRLTPTELVGLLNGIFSTVDGLVEHHQLEKVKTIGDAYMVVGGIPTRMDDHAERVANMALELAAAIERMQAGAEQQVRVRIGMHCGPAVAGVIGVKKFIYDVWGDTVNVASRMESLGAPGRVHVSPAVYERLGDRYEFEPRGLIDVKGKGPMATYFLVGRRGVRGRSRSRAAEGHARPPMRGR